MTIRSKFLALFVPALFVVGIVLSMVFNVWHTESTKKPARYLSGEFAGEYNPSDIRGSYSFGDIAASFAVSVETLAEAFGVTGIDDPEAFKAKDLETLYGKLADGGEVGTDAVRFFVALYTGRPYKPEESTRLPSPSAPLLKDRLSEEEFAALRSLLVSPGDLLEAAGNTETSDAHDGEAEMMIRGKTTFDDLLSWGLTKEEIETILGTAMGSRSSTVRDFLSERELEFSAYKIKLQELVDSKR